MTFHYVLQEATALAWFNMASAAAYNPKLVDAYIDRMMAAIKSTFGNDVCPGCRRVIDNEICWCGEHMNKHSYDHNPVPMGCECGRS